MKAYKGFDRNLRCRDFQYELGESYKHNGSVGSCSSGFHACENPLDVFRYYNPAQSRFCEVVLSGEMCTREDDKISAGEIKIKSEILLTDYIKVCFDFTWSKAKKCKSNHTTGNRSASSATGNQSASSATGYRSASSIEGNKSKNSVAMNIGWGGRAKASKGNWIVIAEHNNNHDIIDIHKAQAGVSKGVKADTWYEIKEGELSEVRGDE